MRAIQLRKPGGLENLYRSELDVGKPGRGEILVRIRATSLNYHDYAVVSGALETRDGIVPMSDASAEVIELGEGVAEHRVGDRVVSAFFPDWESGEPTAARGGAVPGDRIDGYAREFAVVPARYFVRAPAHLSHVEAATLSCAGLTAWRALVVEGGLKAGDTVLVQGTGGVSIFALQIAKLFGATVIATSSSDTKNARQQALGADHVINYRTTPQWGKAAMALTNGRGVDHVVEIGGAGTLNESIRASRIGGHISMIGILAGRQGEVSTGALMGKQIRLHGILVGSCDQLRDFVRAVEINRLQPVIDRSFPLEQLADAFNYQLSNAHIGKIGVDI